MAAIFGPRRGVSYSALLGGTTLGFTDLFL